MTGLTALAEADVAEVMRIERTPGFENFVGRWTAEEHAAALADPHAAYLGIRDGKRLAGFVIVTRMDQPVVHLRRIAVAEPGRGTGTRLLRAVMDRLFETTGAEALDLDVALVNPRAKHVYEREGFTAFRAPDEVHHFLSVPRARWAALRANA